MRLLKPSSAPSSIAPEDRFHPLPAYVLGPSNGVDDTSVINAVLAAAPADSYVRGLHGQTYLISAPLVTRAGGRQTLDMTGCTVRLKTGSDCAMLRNSAYKTTARGAVDIATTATSTTITSATAAFASGDVGKRVIVYGCGTDGADLDTTISSVTNATTVVLAAAPAVTATNIYASIGPRDVSVRVLGGYWDRQGNQGADLMETRNSLCFVRCDGVRVHHVKIRSTAGKYSIYWADVSDVVAGDIDLDVYSDGPHVNGPARNVLIDGVTGRCGDDGVVFLEEEGYSQYIETRGRGTGIMFRNVKAVSTTVGCKLTCSGNVTLGSESDVVVDGCDGGVRVMGEYVAGGIFGSIRLIGCTGAVGLINQAQAFAVRSLTILGHRFDAGGAFAYRGVDIRSGVVVDSITIDSISVRSRGAQTGVVAVDGATAVVDRCAISNANLRSTGNDATLVALYNGGTLRYLSLNGCRTDAAGSGIALSYPSGTTATRIDIQGLQANQFGLGELNTPVELNVVGASNAGSQAFWGTAAVVIDARGLNKDDLPSWISPGAGTFRSRSLAYRVDVARLAKGAGDMAYNTNSGRACGVGPVVCDGTSWKNLYSGATYTP